jgi:hypothetical protein
MQTKKCPRLAAKEATINVAAAQPDDFRGSTKTRAKLKVSSNLENFLRDSNCNRGYLYGRVCLQR